MGDLAMEDLDFLPCEQLQKTGDSFCNRIVTDRRLRHKYLHTACVCLSMMAMGWRMSLTGPTLPDLRLIINEDLARASWIISALAFGGLAGSLIMGTIYDRFNKNMVFATLTLCLALFTAATPFCSTFAAMVAIHALNGACAGGIDTVVAVDVVLLWGDESAPFLQTVNLAFSIGAMISPLTSEPFLATRQKQASDATNLSNTTTAMSLSNQLTTSTYDTNNVLNFTTNATNGNEYIHMFAYGTTRVHWSYVISAVVSALAFLSFVLGYCLLGNVHADQANVHARHDTKGTVTLKHPLSNKLRVVCVVILAIMLSTCVISERIFYSYLATFLIEKLFWTKAQASNATAVFWIAFAISRLLSVIVVKVLKLVIVFVLCLGLLLVAEIILLLAVRLDIPALVWVSCVVYGMGMSALFGGIITWISAKVCPLTGKVSSAVYTITMTGVIVFPLIVGDVMGTISYDWFIYIEFILTCSMIMFVLFLELLYHMLTR